MDSKSQIKGFPPRVSGKMPLEDLIATATRLVCGGLGEYVK